MRFVESVLRALTAFGGVIGVGSILMLMALTVVTVVFRAFDIAFPGTYVIAELLLIPAVSFSLAYAAWAGVHTRVELLVGRFSTRLRGFIEAIMSALGTVFWALVAYAAIRESLKRMAQNELTPILNVPVWPFRWLMVAALLLFCAILVMQIVKSARGELLAEGEMGYDE